MQTQELTLSEQVATLQRQIESLELERVAKAQSLGIPANTAPDKIASVAKSLAGAELGRQERLVSIDLELAALKTRLEQLGEEQQQQERRELEDRVTASRRALEAKAQELDRLTLQVIQTVEEAKAIADRGYCDWKQTTSSLSGYLRQLPDYRVSLPKIVKGGDGFILTSK